MTLWQPVRPIFAHVICHVDHCCWETGKSSSPAKQSLFIFPVSMLWFRERDRFSCSFEKWSLFGFSPTFHEKEGEKIKIKHYQVGCFRFGSSSSSCVRGVVRQIRLGWKVVIINISYLISFFFFLIKKASWFPPLFCFLPNVIVTSQVSAPKLKKSTSFPAYPYRYSLPCIVFTFIPFLLKLTKMSKQILRTFPLHLSLLCCQTHCKNKN